MQYIKIPASVEMIGNCAFFECDFLSEIELSLIHISVAEEVTEGTVEAVDVEEATEEMAKSADMEERCV